MHESVVHVINILWTNLIVIFLKYQISKNESCNTTDDEGENDAM